MISIYADGSSTGRADGAGGYGFVIVRGDTVLAWSYGGSPRTTNNLMEMEGAIQGLTTALDLDLIGRGEPIELVSDSQYALGIANGAYTPSKNLEKAAQLIDLAAKVRCRFRWVRGHQGDIFNEHCDKLAKQGKLENTPEEDIRKAAAKKARKSARKATVQAAK